MDYSVLMAVYYKENPQFLKEAIDSMLNQTVQTNDFVIVCDGELTVELNSVLEIYNNHPAFNIVRLDKNLGIGAAFAFTLPLCKNEFIARMDSDDIALPQRCERQLEVFKEVDVDVVGCNISEFINEPDCLIAERKVPQFNSEIKEYAKKRNPLNHQSVMFKKSKVLESGGYRNFYLMEDYDLWVRMLLNDCKFYNIQEALLKVRVDKNLYMRRGGVDYFKSNKKFQKFMLDMRFISKIRYFLNISERFLVQVIMPNYIRKIFYIKALRKRGS